MPKNVTGSWAARRNPSLCRKPEHVLTIYESDITLPRSASTSDCGLSNDSTAMDGVPAFMIFVIVPTPGSCRFVRGWLHNLPCLASHGEHCSLVEVGIIRWSSQSWQ